MRSVGIRLRKDRTGEGATRLSQPIRVTGSPGRGDGWMPFGFEQSVIGKTHQQWVKRPGFQMCFLQQVIAVPPCVWPCDQRLKDGPGLLRRVRTPSHAPLSIYVDIGGQPALSQPQRDRPLSRLGTANETAGAFSVSMGKREILPYSSLAGVMLTRFAKAMF